MDTGIENVIFKTGRRRLLSNEDSILSKTSNMANVAKNGVFAIISAVKSFSMSVLSNLFSGADMSALISTQNPLTSVITSSVTIPPIAWAQMTYDSVVPIMLDILSFTQNKQFTLKPLWVHMYDTMDRYDEIIHERHKRGCMGFRLMFGYSSSTARALYYNCMAIAEMPRGLWTFILTILVDMNLYRCLCVYPAGKNYVETTFQQCEYLMSPNRKGLWQKLISTRSADALCEEYSKTIETQLYGAFNTWMIYSTHAAEASTNFFDELFIKRTQSMECNNIERNPTAMVLTPTPLYHYQVCTQTSSCRERCQDTIMAFESEYKREEALGRSMSVVNYYNHEIENPIYNIYSNEWTNRQSLYVNAQKFVLALSSENVHEISNVDSICKSKCNVESSNTKCLKVLVEMTKEREFEIELNCLPGPSSIMKTMYNIATYSFSSISNILSSDQDVVCHAEFSIQNISWTGSTFLLMYVTRKQTRTVNNMNTFVDSNEIYLWKSQLDNEMIPQSILSNGDLGNFLSNIDMAKALYGTSVQLYDVQILSLNIINTQELFSDDAGMFTLLFSFEIQIKANQGSSFYLVEEIGSNLKESSESFLIYGIRRYCDPDNSIPNHCLDQELTYFVPCHVCNNIMENEVCLELCNQEIDKVFGLLNHGNLMHISKHRYLFLPSQANFGDDYSFLFESYVKEAAVYTINVKEKNKIIRERTFGLNEKSTSTMDALGNWDRSKVFWTNSLLAKPIRDVRAYEDKKYPVFFISKTGLSKNSLNSEWMQQARLEYEPSEQKFKIVLKNSIVFNGTSVLKTQCDINSCKGCATSKLHLMCSAAQDCALVKCIGSVIQTKNMFCGLGNIFEKMAQHSILTWRALYLSMAEILLIIMRGLIGDIVKEVSLKFPTDQFYTLVCALKDTYASYVGFGISVIEMISSNVFGSSGLNQGLSLIQNNDMVSALVGEQILKISSIGSLVFNLMAGSTLLPTLAMHKWLICITNVSMLQFSSSEFKLEMDDTIMDTSWVGCAKVDGFASLLNEMDVESSLESSIEMFVTFSKSLVTGISDTLLHGFLLSWHAVMDFYIGLVWNFQDILYTFNMKSCKLPDYALRYVLWCSCNDTQYRIPDQKRKATLKDGAFWCVGTMNVNLQDGTTNAIIYNPYSLDTLSEGVAEVIKYVNCLSERADPMLCDTYKTLYNNKLQWLVNQNVEPLVVWAKCKSNYLQSTWDSASGALFMKFEDVYNTDSKNPFISSVSSSLRTEMITWAQEISVEFMNCMQNPSRLRMEYSTCMRLFLDLKTKQTPNAYFVYEKKTSPEPPDACSVFSGISNQNITEHENVFKVCINESSSLNSDDISACKLNPSVWSTSQNSKTSVAKLHGKEVPWKNFSTSRKWNSVAHIYMESKNKLLSAWNAFNTSFEKDRHGIDVQIFSADGDFIHEFFDCMYLGPYSRVDYFPCTAGLECPFYARDEEGGKSREFTPCFGDDVMYNDTSNPYTCGSRGRRSIIKYYFRNVWNPSKLNLNISNRILEKVNSIMKNYTNSNSFFCYDSKTNTCNLEACTFENGFLPCLDTNYNIDEQEMSKFIIDVFMENLDQYFAQTLYDTDPWTYHAGKSGPPNENGDPVYPFQWEKQSQLVLDEGFLKVSEPILKFDKNDTMNIPKPSNASLRDRRLSSLWSLCMGLLSQPSFSIPITKHVWKNEEVELPVGLWEYLLKNSFYSTSYLSQLKDSLNTNNLTEIEILIRSIVQQHIKSHNPFVWHANKRHAPSKSSFCKVSTENVVEGPPGQMRLTDVELKIDNGFPGQETTIKFENENQQEYILNYGFLSKTIGTSHFECVCGHRMHIDQSLCEVEAVSCSQILLWPNTSLSRECMILYHACQSPLRTYRHNQRELVFACLNGMPNTVRCPEFHLSDSWGFYPVDCSDRECRDAKNWIGRGNYAPEYHRMRFMNEGRGGMRLTNYVHHQNTLETEMNFGNKNGTASSYAIPKCYDIVDDIKSAEGKEALLDMIDNEIKVLFPAVQMLYESHVTAFCSRFVIEVARIEMFEIIDATLVEEFVVQALAWKRKCLNKMRQFSSCNMMGVYFDLKPPSDWNVLSDELSGLRVLNAAHNPNLFLTPWGVIVHQESKKIYDGHTCAKKRNSYPTSTSNPQSLPLLDFENDKYDTLECEIHPSPFSFLREWNDDTIALSMVYDTEWGNLLKEDRWIEELMPGISLETLYDMAMESNSEHVSHVLDWWPDEILNFPIGFHATASTDPDEFAPVGFDSQYVYDRSLNTLFYVHTSLRNASLFHENLGACGICRSNTIGLPMFEANTNRICTRLSKHAGEDVPTFPVYQMKQGGGNHDFTPWPYSEAFIDTHFDEEFCTEDQSDIPWTPHDADPLSKTAGNIPGWIYTAFMDEKGETWYNTESDHVYPPTEGYMLHEINEIKVFGSKSETVNRTWGVCKGVIDWKATHLCDVINTSMTCPDFRSSCLRIEESQSHGVCFPNYAYAASVLKGKSSDTRYPCFASFHCPENQVCLADGGCSPVYLHFWNTEDTKMEVSVLADECGFVQKNHPYTQNTRGASPWEDVPDILDIHGFCSKHNWFTFRHSLNIGLCPLHSNNVEYMLCDSNTTKWPWIIERFDGTTSNIENAQTMKNEETLFLKPDVCDQSFMHLQNPFKGSRFEVCSGHQGERISVQRDAYVNYELNGGTWEGKMIYENITSAPESAWWMRTYVEATNEIPIGKLLYDQGNQDKPLGFLGADLRQTNALYDLGFDNTNKDRFHFLKCMDRAECQPPVFTFNGLVSMRVDSSLLPSIIQNHTEKSLRLCGSIGYIDENVCVVDMQLFPLLSFFLVSRAYTSSCEKLLWSQEVFIDKFKIVLYRNDNDFERTRQLQEHIDVLHCISGECRYAPRDSDEITTANENDHINAITNKLNDIIGESIRDIATKGIETYKQYELINLCMIEIYDHNQVHQTTIQEIYESAEPSGIYLGLKVTLLELPLQWLLHAWHISLLSSINPSFQVPNLESMLLEGNNFDLNLWSNCPEENVNKSTYVYILCKNKHASHTLNMESMSKVENFIQEMTQRITNDVISKLAIRKEEMNVKCYKKARRNCNKFTNFADYQKCQKALYFVHNTTDSKDQTNDGINYCLRYLGDWTQLSNEGVEKQFLDPCTNYSNFDLSEETTLPTEYLNQYAGYGPNLNSIIESLAQILRETLTSKMKEVIKRVDYIRGKNTLDLVDIVHIQRFDDFIQHRQNQLLDMNLKDYFEQKVCESKFIVDQAEMTCKYQTNISYTTPCLFQDSDTTREYFKFVDEDSTIFKNNKNIITIRYFDDTEQTIDICDALDTYRQEETCFVQHLGNLSKIEELDVVKCDIKEIYAPPGVEVQAFGYISDDKGVWSSIIQNTPDGVDTSGEMCQISNVNVRQCTWKFNPLTMEGTPENAWWYGSYVTKGAGTEKIWSDTYMDRSTRLEVSIDRQLTGWWQTDNKRWEEKGCANFGVCAIKIRLENIPSQSKTQCYLKIPTCQDIAPDKIMRPYALSRTIDSQHGQLIRCAPCVRKDTNVFHDDGLFGCQLRDSSNNPITSVAESLSMQSIREKLPYLYNVEATRNIFKSYEDLLSFSGDENNKIAASVKLEGNHPVDEKYVRYWKKRRRESPCVNFCQRERVELDSAREMDIRLWNKIISEPSKRNILLCNEQKLRVSDFKKCNPHVDVLRQQLKSMTESVYRKHNGVWMPIVEPGHGLAWQASVANRNVNMFSIMFQSSERSLLDVKTKYILSDDICASSESLLSDRICVESKRNSFWPIEIMNPWLGGNFNPFHGERGLDECFTADTVTLNRRRVLCRCDCSPQEFCKDPNNIYNYSKSFEQSEFKIEDECSQRSYPRFHVMSDNDDTNLCSKVRKSVKASVCHHRQGLFGGKNLFAEYETVNFENFHSKHGIHTENTDFLIESMLEKNNGLWLGKTLFEIDSNQKKYAFLKMPRTEMHPGHIVFGFDTTKTGSPLLIKTISLLKNEDIIIPKSIMSPKQWLSSLEQDLLKDAIFSDNTYPNFMEEKINNGGGHWSCPFRKLSFWTNTEDSYFAPKIPNPLLTKLLFKKYRGMHPLVQLTDASAKLKDYKTTNGICFYEEDGHSNVVIPIEDAVNPCGLKQIFKQHIHQKYSLSRVMSHFESRCMDIIDFPGLNATLRSGEKVNNDYVVSKCGVLHRLTPFLMRTVGNKGYVKINRAGLRTHSEGGDCHMGRVFEYPYNNKNDLVGKQCLLTQKTKLTGRVKCEGIAFWGDSQTEYELKRSRPLSATEISKKTVRRFQTDVLSRRIPILPTYILSGSVEAQQPEVSIGLLYRAPLPRILADDLLHFCKNKDCPFQTPWLGGRAFLKRYTDKSLLQKNTTSTKRNINVIRLKELLLRGYVFTGQNDSLGEYIVSKLRNEEIWKRSDWTWSYYTRDEQQNVSRKFIGNLSSPAAWKKNRFKTCNESYYDSIVNNNHDTKIDFTTMRVTLCEPAPTGGLQEFCKALSTFRQEIQTINCQVMGDNDCLYQPYMFYLPYEWSTTNLRFSSETVRNYYEEIFKTYMPNADFAKYCPAKSLLDSNLIRMSKQAENICPANKIEYLKDAFESIKYLGSRILYLAYCLVMFVVNILAMVFSKSTEASNAMFTLAMMYFKFFMDEVTQIAMPLLNAFVELLFGTSDAGKAFKAVLQFLCDRFNTALDILVYTIWCPIVLPIIYNIFFWLKLLVTIDSSAVEKLDQAWNFISRGIGSGYNYDKCFAVFGGRIKCKYTPEERSFNATTFSTQAFATRCWVSTQNKNGYSNVFSGSTEFSYLSCNVGDTCAIDSTMFDDYVQGKLIPCASCPSITSENGQSFGCNTYLKRCTCFTRTQSISSCYSNEDCQQSKSTCSMATSIEFARSSAASMECSACGQLNQEPICIMDGVESTGVCTCASVQQTSFLQTCSEEFSGGIALIDPTKQCLVSNNDNLINVEDVTIQMDFSDLAVGPCVLGKVQRGNIMCMRVTLPLSSKTSTLTKNFVVLVNFQSQSENILSVSMDLLNVQSGRRLLSAKQENGILHLVDKCLHFTGNSSSREVVKECIDILEFSNILKTWHGITILEEDPFLMVKNKYWWFLHNNMREQLFNNEYALHLTLTKMNTPFAYAAVGRAMNWIQKQIQIRENISITAKKNSSTMRRLLQEEPISNSPSLFQCDSLMYITSEIADAFWTTVKYYDRQSLNLSSKSSLFFYNYPSFENERLVDTESDSLYNIFAYKAISLLFSGGNVEGKRILKSFSSNISESDAAENNYFTGKRFIADIAKCNYSRLTFGPDPPRSILPWFLILVFIIFMISSCCSSSSVISILLWVIVFPIIFLWSAYNTSPLCFPMIPPSLPHDLISEIKPMIPSRIEIPYFLIKTPCLTYKRVTNKTSSKLIPDSSKVLMTVKDMNNNDCFKKCTDKPFLMKSWQDPLAWWMCEISTSGCHSIASFTEKISFLKDFTSSSYYFEKVIDSGKLDQDFMRAHRFCALFTTHEVIISGIILATLVLIVPSVIQSVFDIFLNAIVLVVHANNAEHID